MTEINVITGYRLVLVPKGQKAPWRITSIAQTHDMKDDLRIAKQVLNDYIVNDLAINNIGPGIASHHNPRWALVKIAEPEFNDWGEVSP